MKTIEIPAPKFDLYEEVVIFWNERELPGKIVKRWLDLDKGFYWYQIHASDRLYPENVVVAR